VPDDRWLAMSRPSGIDKYHAAIEKLLDEEFVETPDLRHMTHARHKCASQ
jgi:hypothetical protein